jgi:YD repeat-containing protein
VRNHLLNNPACTTCTYDAAGNLTQKVCSGLTTTCEYNALGRLTMAAPPGEPTAYCTYDALG